MKTAVLKSAVLAAVQAVYEERGLGPVKQVHAASHRAGIGQRRFFVFRALGCVVWSLSAVRGPNALKKEHAKEGVTGQALLRFVAGSEDSLTVCVDARPGA